MKIFILLLAITIQAQLKKSDTLYIFLEPKNESIKISKHKNTIFIKMCLIEDCAQLEYRKFHYFKNKSFILNKNEIIKEEILNISKLQKEKIRILNNYKRLFFISNLTDKEYLVYPGYASIYR